MGKSGIDIFDILLVLAKRKKFIIITTIVVTLAVLIYSLLAPKYWVSAVKFLPVSQERSAIPMAQQLLGGFGASFLGQELTGTAKNHTNILMSRTFSERIINRFDLIDYFKITDPDPLVRMELAIKDLLEKVVSTEIDIETGMISIFVETKDKFLSRDIANAYYEMLEDYNINTKMTKGRERRIFLEERISDFEETFARHTGKLEKFQSEHRVVDLQKQTESIIELYAEIVASKIEAEIELEYNLRQLSEESPIVMTLKQRIATLNEAIENLERGEEGINPNYIVNIDDIPGLANQYMQLNLNVEIQTRIIEFLYPQYEQARLDELSDISSFELIDEAVPAGLKSRPKRAIMVIAAFLASLILSSLFAYAQEILNETHRKEKLQALMHELFRKKK